MNGGGSDAATWVGAIGTCAAVVVALFGSPLQRWWRRPKLVLQHDDDALESDEAIFVSGEPRRPHVVTLLVINRGRTQADDVEAVVSVHQRFGPETTEAGPIPEFEVPSVSRGALRFELASAGQTHVPVPPRSVRTLQFVRLGTADHIHAAIASNGDDPSAAEHPSHGMLCVHPAPDADRAVFLPEDDVVRVTIELQARNARASRWEAHVKVWQWDAREAEDGEGLAGVQLEWVRPFRPTRSRLPQSARQVWVRSHTPLALWREHRFQRLMREEDEPTE